MKIALSATLLLIAASMPATAFELDERLLGISELPYRVGQTIPADKLAARRCAPTETHLQMCPIGQIEGYGFAILVEPRPEGGYVAGVMSLQRCQPEECEARVEATVTALERELGAKHEQLDGRAIWKDREKNRRDLLVDPFAPGMFAIMLVESDPEPAP